MIQIREVAKDEEERRNLEESLKEIIAYRRALHQIPEVGLELPKTKNYVEERLREFGLQPREVGPGIVVDFGNTPYVGIRADMDALPLKELRDVPYKSKHEGFMHACGHDAHTAVLLALAHHFAKIPPSIGVRLIFQPGEEGYAGAKHMIEAGVLESVKVIIGEHVGSMAGNELEPGTVVSKKGPFMASDDKISIIFEGKGTHGSMPHTGIDPIIAAANYIISAYNMKTRELNQTHPTVISFGKVQSGTAHNIIPRQAEISGTVRTMLTEDREYITKRLEEIAQAIGKMYRTKVNFEREPLYPPLQNSPDIVSMVENITKKNGLAYIESPEPVMGSEDFAYYLEKIPGAFFFVNTGNTEKGITAPNHSPYFDVYEDALWVPFFIFLKFVEEWKR